jgi:hypothetical protein
VEVLRFRDGLAGQDLRDVRAVLAHRDDDEAQPHVGMAAGGVVHAESTARMDWRGVSRRRCG